MKQVPFLALVAALVMIGPDWPSRTTELLCGNDFKVLGVFADMDTCLGSIAQGCSCSVRENWFAWIYYLLLVPGGFVAAVLMTSRAIGRAVATVLTLVAVVLLLPWPVAMLYGAGVNLPGFV